MNIYDFKMRLQTIVGQSPDTYRAVDIVAEACAQMLALKIDPISMGEVLTQAANIAVEENDTGDRFLRFLRMQENISRRTREYFDDPDVRERLGLPKSGA